MDDWKLELSPPTPAPAEKDTRRLRWWFLRVTGVGGPACLARVRSLVSRAGKIYEEGFGTVANPEAVWFVVRTRCATVAEIRERLGAEHVSVDLIEEVDHRSHARTLARQMPLIG